ncbi:MAG: carbon-nitrogen hydrolase family protein [Solirubrobacteraceae bacterium]
MSAPRRRRSTIPALVGVAAPVGPGLEQTFAQIERTLRDARAVGAGLVVFPECMLGGYPIEGVDGGRTAPTPPALHLDGPEIARLSRLAAGMTVCAGFTEDGPGGPYNSAVCVSGDGVLGHYRKVHLPPSERFAYRAGDRFGAFDTPVGRVGMLICYDKLFPEAARILADDGAQIIAAMSAWPVSRLRPARRLARDHQTLHFDLLDRTRAIENQVVWVSSNQSGHSGGLRFLGHAKVVDPDGRVLASTRGGRAGLATARIDPAEATAATRAALCHLDDRRGASYLLRPATERDTMTLDRPMSMASMSMAPDRVMSMVPTT